ncbi:MAG: NAD(P)/FAD-dependent oxidoreductase [Planctomycetota bacterium]
MGRSVAVIGAGPAGSTAAIRMRNLGLEVTIFEKRTFPREKVCGCCLSTSGWKRVKGLLGADPINLPKHQALHKFELILDERRSAIRQSGGCVVSRSSLDSELLERAQQIGASLIPHRALIRPKSDLTDDQVRLQAGEQIYKFDAVVLAAGLNGGDAGNRLSWLDSPHGPRGFWLRTKQRIVEAGALRMFADDTGYVGVVETADGWTDIAAAVHHPTRTSQRKNESRKSTPSAFLCQWLAAYGIDLQADQVIEHQTTGPLRRRRLPCRDRVFAIGDSRSYVEPFTGEGMTWAIDDAWLLADAIAAESTQNQAIDWGRVEKRYQALTHLADRTRSRQVRWLSAILRRKWTRWTLGRAINFFPRLASGLHPWRET